MRKGTHGTCASRAESIVQNGFSLSSVGLRGTGIYFWGYSDMSLKAKAANLALCWHAFAQKRGDYSKDTDQSAAVIFAVIHVEGDELLDLESDLIRDKFEAFVLSISEKHPDLGTDTAESISKTYDVFIDLLEKKMGAPFKAIHVRVQPPKTYKGGLSKNYTGNPSCYVVKDQQVIDVEGCEV